MCGICGKLDFSGAKVDEGLVRRMTAMMEHRGPDDFGVYLNHREKVSCGLGHRRLSIIDLTEAGRQPMPNEERNLWMVFNGEIYNFAALRKFALALLRQDTQYPKRSLRSRRKTAERLPDYRAALLGLVPRG